ncbi:hypothetical protein WN944_024689 [Citrus x changshan-huyou]|uniref:Uncharacterized protein n=1 Tax=Citrus x changshan-huyou TaxID=2935761 RepID=A0AAP0QFZ1_9ROSI
MKKKNIGGRRKPPTGDDQRRPEDATIIGVCKRNTVSAFLGDKFVSRATSLRNLMIQHLFSTSKAIEMSYHLFWHLPVAVDRHRSVAFSDHLCFSSSWVMYALDVYFFLFQQMRVADMPNVFFDGHPQLVTAANTSQNVNLREIMPDHLLHNKVSILLANK